MTPDPRRDTGQVWDGPDTRGDILHCTCHPGVAWQWTRWPARTNAWAIIGHIGDGYLADPTTKLYGYAAGVTSFRRDHPEAEENPVTLRARSCPTCHSIGERFVLSSPGRVGVLCTDSWHVEACCPEFAATGHAHTEFCPGFDTPEADPAVWVAMQRAAASATTEPDEPQYRVGRKVGRTIYRNDVLIGVMDTPELAQLAVDGMTDRDCGHDLEAIQRQGAELARIIRERDGASTLAGDLVDKLDEARTERDRLARELETLTAVALGNKQHVAYITEYAQGVEVERDRLADTVRQVRAVIDEARPNGPGIRDVERALDASPGDAKSSGDVQIPAQPASGADIHTPIGEAESGQRDEAHGIGDGDAP